MPKSYILIGSDVSQSLSPEIYRELAQADERPFHYQLASLGPAASQEQLQRYIESADGGNVTIPYKCDRHLLKHYSLSREARHLGAVNVFKKVGVKIQFDNSDWKALFQMMFKDPSFRRNRSLIVGAGGAARAAAYALSRVHAPSPKIINRSSHRGLRFQQWMHNQLVFDNRGRQTIGLDTIKNLIIAVPCLKRYRAAISPIRRQIQSVIDMRTSPRGPFETFTIRQGKTGKEMLWLQAQENYIWWKQPS